MRASDELFHCESLLQILDKDIGSRIIHYGTIDIEGYEFPILKEFEDFGRYHSNGVAVCQVRR